MVGGFDSVWKSCSYADTLNKNPINYTYSESLLIIEYNHIFEINFSKSQCCSDIRRNTQKHCFASIGSLPRMNYWSSTFNIGNVFSHITLKKCVCDFPGGFFFTTS